MAAGAVIAAVTLLPMPEGAESVPLFDGADKLVHAVLFGLFAAVFMLDYCRGRGVGRASVGTMLLSVAVSAAYGAAIELLQQLMDEGRSGDLYDWLADVAGAFAAVIVLRGVVKRMLRCCGVRLRKISRMDGDISGLYEGMYLNSFPPEERRGWACVREFAADKCHPLSFYEILCGGKRVGFITAWMLPGGWTYVEHFVVSAECRGKGIGYWAMTRFCACHDKVVLEVELSERGETAARRVAFYERCGFRAYADFEYVQPSYGDGLPEVAMMLMVYGTVTEPLDAVSGSLKRIVYGKV